MSNARRFGGAGIRRGVRALAAAVASGELTIEAAIIAAAAAGSLTAGGIFLCRSADLTLETGDRVSNWVNHGTGGDATQGTDASRPTYGSTGLNSLPGLTCDGGDSLLTANIDSGSATAYAIVQVMSRSGGSFAASFGNITGTSGLALKAGPAGAQALGGSSSRAESAANVSAAEVTTATYDSALTSSCTEVRSDGVAVTNTRPVDGNATGSIGDKPITIGARQGPANHLTGVIGACVVLWGTGSWSGAQLTALEDIEDLLTAEWGL